MTAPSLTPRVRTMQVIAAALVLGVLSFLAVAVVIRQRQEDPPPDVPVVLLVSVVVLVSNSTAALLIPPVIQAAGLRRLAGGGMSAGADETTQLLGLRLTVLLVPLALLEAAAFLGGVAYLVDASPFGLAVTGVAVVLMLFYFPTEDGVRQWLTQARQQLERLRLRAKTGRPISG